MVKAALTMLHTQRGLKDRECVLGLVSHLYKDSVAFVTLIFFFFNFFREIGHDTKESSLSATLFTGHLGGVWFVFSNHHF